jgi:4-hydroxybenzoate polyprenyltransferase
MANNNDIPLCIDCDGTLIRTDLLHEAVFILLKSHPFHIFLLPLWLLKGKAHLKERLTALVEFQWNTMPFREEVLELIRNARAAGRKVILVTASPQIWADSLAAHLGLFDAVLGTQDKNLAGKNKADELVRLYGEKKFDYAGDSKPDLKVWAVANGAIVVTKSETLATKAKAVCPVEQVIYKDKAKLLTYVKALRVHQWLKNLLIFVPVMAAHKLNDNAIVIDAVLAFLAFSACASAVYVINDLLDLESDRVHVRKRRRPFAACLIPISRGAMLVPFLLGSSIGLALLSTTNFIWILVLYFAVTLAYSFKLKRQVIVDVMTLAGLYTMRIIAGAAATQIMPSFWLLAFSMFIFLSLALVKRYSELLVTLEQNKEETHGRGYLTSDLPVLMALGVSASMNAVLVFAFYLNLPEVNALYPHKKWLWLISPVLLYWLSRMWMKTHRGQMDDDPIVFAVKDWQSLVVLIISGGLFVAASIP